MKVKRALISVSDKANLEKFVRGLKELGVEILSTGGTARFIKNLGIEVTNVSDYTGFPEIMDGRVKTLHPKIHGALLSLRDEDEHMQQAKEHDIKLIDMVVINLYPFAEVISRKNVALEEALENIDIGGPSILRSAAKNFKSIAVISDPNIYDEILVELKENDCSLSNKTLQKLALEAFKKTSGYDNLIFNYLLRQAGEARTPSQSVFPDQMKIEFSKVRDLRYGENPHQRAAFYRDVVSPGLLSLANAKKLHGKDLSFNNLIDLNAALEVAGEFEEPAACIVKHATPCGVAVAGNIKDAFVSALDCDRLSAFGGIIGLNRMLDEPIAKEIVKAGFLECIIAPGYDNKALKMLTKKKNLRILQTQDFKKDVASGAKLDIKKVTGGVLFQEKDKRDVDKKNLKIVTKKRPTDGELESLYFAWKVVKHIKSNAIVLCRGKKTVGIGSGQMSRVDSVMIAVKKAREKTKDSVLASDGFFPKSDSIRFAARAGVSSIIQPGGSVADQEIIDAVDRAGMNMVFTGIRHFKH